MWGQEYPLESLRSSGGPKPHPYQGNNRQCRTGNNGRKGTEIGRSFEEIARIYDGVVYNDKLRVCFDTCHTNDSGYDVKNNFDGVIDEFDRILGKDQIAVFHINDSKNPMGARKDRHANIGFGTIGFDAFTPLCITLILKMFPRFSKLPISPLPKIQKSLSLLIGKKYRC